MSGQAKFEVLYTVVRNGTEGLVIRDVGPHHLHPTVTNDAEGVVRRLFEAQLLKTGQRLFYYDSENSLAELLIDEEKKFRGFAPA